MSHCIGCLMLLMLIVFSVFYSCINNKRKQVKNFNLLMKWFFKNWTPFSSHFLHNNNIHQHRREKRILPTFHCTQLCSSFGAELWHLRNACYEGNIKQGQVTCSIKRYLICNHTSCYIEISWPDHEYGHYQIFGICIGPSFTYSSSFFTLNFSCL